MPLDIDRPALSQSILALTHGETDTVALMATMACEIHHHHPLSDWTGFYRVTAPELLKIGPYQGGHGCLVIPFSRGVCGACARNARNRYVIQKARCIGQDFRKSCLVRCGGQKADKGHVFLLHFW